jgi:UDP-2-acetamido-3-amino-2,3-dideoxy-glucuronate N-acetyltransferase
LARGIGERTWSATFFELDALQAVCDASGAVEGELKTKYPAVAFVRDYGALLADDSIRAVALATPAVTHFEMARQALEAGKDVLVEKPLSIRVEDGEQLVALAPRGNAS